jgi:3-hydroxyisobutyrate dehydrogenase
VGAGLSRRLSSHGYDVKIYDPEPRIPIKCGSVNSLAESGKVDVVICAVTPSNAIEAARATTMMRERPSWYLDFNTLSPSMKALIEEIVPCEVIDVALLELLDGGLDHPWIAMSGKSARDLVPVMNQLGFDAHLVGKEVGQAASVKFARSLFMKSLEALVLEHAAIVERLGIGEVVHASIDKSLEPGFARTALLMLATNRIHGDRRASELAEVVASFADQGIHSEVATAAVRSLRWSAASWMKGDAPLPDASTDDLVRYLAEKLPKGV